MLLHEQLTLSCDHGVVNEAVHLFHKLVFEILARPALRQWILTYSLEKSIQTDDISLFKLTVFLTVLLDSIVGKLHEDLLLWRYLRIVVNVFLRAGSYIRLLEHVAFTVTRVEENPNSDIKFSF